MPIFAGGKIEARETREIVQPAMARGVHGQSEVTIMFQEGDSVSGKKSLLPPFEIFTTGLINEDRDLRGRSEAFRGEDSTREESTRSDNICSIEELACE